MYNKEIISKLLIIDLDFNDLKKLYTKSEYLIFPSLNESFGLPLIESIQFN